jgi:hypothetical protein
LGDCAGWQSELVSDTNVVVAGAAGEGGRTEGRSGVVGVGQMVSEAGMMHCYYLSCISVDCHWPRKLLCHRLFAFDDEGSDPWQDSQQTNSVVGHSMMVSMSCAQKFTL